MNKIICRITGYLLHGFILTLLLSLIILTTCSLEGDIESKRTKPDNSNNPSNHGNPDNPDVPVNPPQQTAFILFDNTQGICNVAVYNDYRRRDEDKIAEIPAGGSSGEIAWTSGVSIPFYFSYSLKVKNINDFILNYVPDIGKDQKAVRIDAGVTTTIKIPTLSETISSPDKLFSDNSYLLIKNNSSFSFQLHRGTSILKPDNISSPLVNDGERAQYTVNPGPASNYRLLVGADYYTFPDSPGSFEAGHIYNFNFNYGISLITNTELKLENIYGVTIPQPPAAPVVITSNGALTLQWTAVESAAAYEIWISTVNEPASAAKYGTDVTGSLSANISGLNNGTIYYIWLKAKNNLGTSDFSPATSGTPTASTVKPPDPKIAPSIVAGNGQLTVSWQPVEDTIVYEIWTGTTNNTQTASKRDEDTAGLFAVITGLNNGTTYYVWIRAKNSRGVSGFSPSATGKPLGTPGTPTVSPAYKGLFVTWTAVAGAEQYEVYYGIGSPTTLATTTAGTTATISGLTASTTYYVCIRAKNAKGVSEYGTSASGVPSDSPSTELYRGTEKIGDHNLTSALSWISTNAVSGNNFFIVLKANEFISPKTLSYSNKTVGITISGSDIERNITLAENGSMFTVGSGVTLTLNENITLVGRSANNYSLVSVSGGNLIMNNGAKITENNIATSGRGSGVYVTSGNFTMHGGQISSNTCYEGGGVHIYNGNFTMNGGIINGNIANSSGGGVYVNSNGSFTMKGGEISGNKAVSWHGGGIDVNSNGILTMNGGIINGNTAKVYGGGVNSKGTFTMSGGDINGNTANNSGGGVHVESGIFTKSGGGTITGYISNTINGNVVKNNSGVVQSNSGHAVGGSKRRESTAGPGINLDSRVSGAAGGWEN